MTTLEIEETGAQSQPQEGSAVPRVALLTPYSGGNLGDAAIQDSMIANLRQRIPQAQFLGITLNCQNFLNHHGDAAFPLLASAVRLRAKDETSSNAKEAGSRHQLGEETKLSNNRPRMHSARQAVKMIPGAARLLKQARARMEMLRQEIRHAMEGYRILRTQDLLVLSGGGQLDEEYGGAWRLPFAYFKWTFLARLAGVPCAMASIGVGSLRQPKSRFFVRMALRTCRYRSFRETRSRTKVGDIYRAAKNDPVVPDLAFSLPDSELSSPDQSLRKMAGGRPIVALSPIAYGKPINWPIADQNLYARYVRQIADVLVGLVQRGYFVAVVCSSLGDDESVVPDIMERLGSATSGELKGNVCFPTVENWKGFISVMRAVDFLIASRLHGTILGFVSKVPAVAIAFDPKVDWVMEDLGQSDYLLHIRDFTAADVFGALSRLRENAKMAVERITFFRQGVLEGTESARQYDVLARLAMSHLRTSN